MMGNIQLCAYGPDGVSNSDIPECLTWYASPASGKLAARGILASYPQISAIWVRKIKDAHMRTVAYITRES